MWLLGASERLKAGYGFGTHRFAARVGLALVWARGRTSGLTQRMRDATMTALGWPAKF